MKWALASATARAFDKKHEFLEEPLLILANCILGFINES